jgi:hypothetical protein
VAPVPAVKVQFGGPRTSWLGFLVVGSAIVVIWKWGSLSWHARGAILAAYGVTLLGAVLIPALRTRGLLKSGVQAQGTVVGAERDTSHRHDGTISTATYKPVVRFTTADGRTVQFTSAVGYSYSPDIGGPVPVRYRPDDPDQAEIDRTAMWMLPAAVGLAGGLGLLVAGVIVYSSTATSGSPAAASTAANSAAPSASQPANSPAGTSSPAPSGPDMLALGQTVTLADPSSNAAIGTVTAESATVTTRPAQSYGYRPAHGYFVVVQVKATADPSYPDGWEISEDEFYALVRGTHYDPGNGYAIMALTDAQSTADITTVLAAGETARGWMAFDVPSRHGYIAYAPNPNGQPVAEWKY